MPLDAESLKTLDSLSGKSGTLSLRGDQGDIGGGMFVIGEGGLAAVGDRCWRPREMQLACGAACSPNQNRAMNPASLAPEAPELAYRSVWRALVELPT